MKVRSFNEMYDGSFYTITGCGGDLKEWVDGYTNLLENGNIADLEEDDWSTFTGKDMNDYYHLTGRNRYPDDLVFLAFSLKNVHNVGALAMFKLEMGDRWFDDIVDNNAAREEK